jgi:hypothetical protein
MCRPGTWVYRAGGIAGRDTAGADVLGPGGGAGAARDGGAAAQPELIGGQFAALGAALGRAQPGAGDAAVRRAVLGELHGRERWLLVFDNAEGPGDITGWLPGGARYVLIAPRADGWDEVAAPVVGTLERGESVTLLRRRVPSLDEADAGLVAEAAGDVPLALAQAAYMAPAGITAAG